MQDIAHRREKFQTKKYYMTQCRKPVELHETKLEKDLGIHTEPESIFSEHCEKQVNKGNQILCLICRTYFYLDAESVTRLYPSLV